MIALSSFRLLAELSLEAWIAGNDQAPGSNAKVPSKSLIVTPKRTWARARIHKWKQFPVASGLLKYQDHAWPKTLVSGWKAQADSSAAEALEVTIDDWLVDHIRAPSQTLL